MAVSDLILPKKYESKLSLIQTEEAIKFVKDTFEKNLSSHLNLMRISAPLFVPLSSGLNDNLSGIERPVVFDIKETGVDVEIVHSLAKWKRMALHKYQFSCNSGLYTDMNAIRRDEVLDNIHSVYVDQWDWEIVISKENRNITTLKNTVCSIMKALKETELAVNKKYSNLEPVIQEDVYFITSQELEDRYPNLTPKEREYQITKEYKSVFIMKIGDKLQSGIPHDKRAPDYDDWELNGDILIYYPLLDMAIEISSMGIRVDEQSLLLQLEKSNQLERQTLPFHQALLNQLLPLTMGGGIGQSRICLILLNKAHIGEVQVSSWSDEMYEVCQKHHIQLL